MDGPTLTLNGRPRIRGGGALRAGTRPTHSLVLWSGGIDSTYCLLRLLRESADAVFSHHVRIERGLSSGALARRADFQAAAVQRLLVVLQETARPFHHSTSRVDLSGIGAATGEAALLGFLAAHAAMAHGFTPFDRVLVGVNADADPGWQPDSAACALRRARLARALRAAWGCDEVPQIYLWEPRPAKAQMRDYLGEDIASRTVSCLRPRTVEACAEEGAGLAPCGDCVKCLWRSPQPAAGAVSGSDPGGAAAPSPPPFRHLVSALSRMPAPADPAAASDPPGP